MLEDLEDIWRYKANQTRNMAPIQVVSTENHQTNKWFIDWTWNMKIWIKLKKVIQQITTIITLMCKVSPLEVSTKSVLSVTV